MKIMLAAPELHPDDLGSNQRQMLATMEQAAREGADLLLFGEASLPGFDALSFDYAKDIRKVLSLHSPEIAVMQDAACHHAVAFTKIIWEGFIAAILFWINREELQNYIVEFHRGGKKREPVWTTAKVYPFSPSP